MIEISLGKMVLLALIALIVLGPEKLPGAARTAGALMRRVRGGWDNVRAEVERELEIEQIKRTAREAAAQAESTQNAIKDGLKDVHAPLSAVAADVAAMARAGDVMTELDPAARAALADIGAETAAIEDDRQPDLPLMQPAALADAKEKTSHDDA